MLPAPLCGRERLDDVLTIGYRDEQQRLWKDVKPIQHQPERWWKFGWGRRFGSDER